MGSGRTAKPHGRLPKEEEGPDGWPHPSAAEREEEGEKALAGWLGLDRGREGGAGEELGRKAEGG